MIVLGLFAEGPNPSACLVIDGRVIAFAEEERFTRVKTSPDSYPVQASRFCLHCVSVSFSDVDFIAFAWDSSKYFEKCSCPSYMRIFYNSLNERYNKDPVTLESENRILNRFHPRNIESRIQNLVSEIDPEATCPPIRFVSHHLAHAASSFYASGFDHASILTMDGSGEENCTVLWEGFGTTIARIESFDIPNSLGWFFSAFTEYLGMVPYLDEGKIMGLAAFGRNNSEYSKIISRFLQIYDNCTYSVNPYYTFYGTHYWGKRFTDKLVLDLGEPSSLLISPSQDQKDLAYEMQNRLEDTICALIKRLVRKTNLPNVCIAGGVAMNSKMNGTILKLRRDSIIDSLFVQPISNDAGTSLGAALYISNKVDSDSRFKMEHVFWGPEFSNYDIKLELDRYNLQYRHCRNIVGDVARRISEGKVIGWFQNRMEAGPRSLGNRSILADPRSVHSKDIVNRKVKDRETWRPFAASILDEDKCNYISDAVDAPFMISCFEVTDKFRKELPATLHVDGTTRPQTVRKDINYKFWKVIKEFERITGVPALLNTSFNDKGNPIVCTPSDAIKCFLRTQMDCLAINEYLVER